MYGSSQCLRYLQVPLPQPADLLSYLLGLRRAEVSDDVRDRKSILQGVVAAWVAHTRLCSRRANYALPLISARLRYLQRCVADFLLVLL